MFIPEVVYFATYMAIADNQLYDKEWHRIDRFINENQYDEIVRENVLAIIKDLPEKKSLDDVLDILAKASDVEKYQALRLGYKVAYSDGYFGEKEQVLFDINRRRLGINKTIDKNIQSDITISKVVSEEEDNNFMKERYTNSFFSSEKYAKTIEELKDRTLVDINLVEKELENIARICRTYPEVLKNQTEKMIKSSKICNVEDEKKKLKDFFEELQKVIDESVVRQDSTINSLLDKQKSVVGKYTISFMGRTKAGKSTLHSVLLGGINGDFIGKGSERTTRYNYIYDFHGIRIIDTPGIGAPGGKQDVEIAEEVLDESDLICYVVTSDSIQETEFNFLKKLKERNKPVIILLNKKDNFKRSMKKTQEFIENPLGWYNNEGEDSIQGHIDRINTYVSINHDFHNYQIIPVHLLAAKLSLLEEDPQIKEKYFEGSRLQAFLEELSEQIQSRGKLLKSQSIYNSAIYHICSETEVTIDQIKALNGLKNEIEKNGKEGIDKINKVYDKKRNELINSFNTVFNQFIAKDVKEFSDANYGDDRKEINNKWKEFLRINPIEEKLKNTYERITDQYKSTVEDILSDVNENISFSINFGHLSEIKTLKVFDLKFGMGIFSGLLGVASAIFVLFMASNPVGWVLLGLSAVFGVAATLVKSKQKQINNSQLKLYESLKKDLEEIRKLNLEKLLKSFDEQHREASKKIKGYYDLLLEIFEKTESKLIYLNEVQKSAEATLNKAYSTRIIEYMIHATINDVEKNEIFSNIRVEREFGRCLKIIYKELYIQPVYVKAEIISSMLQENILVETGG